MMPTDLWFRFRDYFDDTGRARPGCALRVEGHAHTDHADGYSAARACVEYALECGLEILVFAEHMRRGAPWRVAYFADIAELKREFAGRLRIVCGIEATVENGSGDLDTDPEALACADLVVGSVHGLWRAGQGGDETAYDAPDAARTLDLETELLEGLIRNPDVQVIGHPFGAYFEKFGRPPRDAVLGLLRHAAAARKAVELNVRHMDAPWLARCAARANADFLFWPASDAHLARHVGRAARALFPECG